MILQVEIWSESFSGNKHPVKSMESKPGPLVDTNFGAGQGGHVQSIERLKMSDDLLQITPNKN